MNAKTALMGFIIGLSLGVGCVVASQSFSIKGLIIIPAATGVKLIGLEENPLGYFELPTVTLSRNTTNIRFELQNRGSKNSQIVWSVESDSPDLIFEMEAYEEYSNKGNLLESSNTFILPRGEMVTMQLLITDAGVQPGQILNFAIYLSASEA